jgi:hypothetical protein
METSMGCTQQAGRPFLSPPTRLGGRPDRIERMGAGLSKKADPGGVR